MLHYDRKEVIKQVPLILAKFTSDSHHHYNYNYYYYSLVEIMNNPHRTTQKCKYFENNILSIFCNN